MNTKAIISGIWVGILLCSAVNLQAQKKLDSILAAHRNTIFDAPDRAIEVGNEVYAQATNTQTRINALILVSNAYLSKRDNPKSLEYVLRAKEHLQKIDNPLTRVTVLNRIGMQHQQLRIYDKAIEYLDEALSLAENLPSQDSLPPLLGYNYTIRGFIYREQMSCDIALNYFDKATEQFKKAMDNPAMVANLSTLSYNKGKCFLQLSQIDSARANFKRAVNYAQSVGANSLYAFAKKGLSEVYTAEGNYSQAIIELKQAESSSENVGDLILNYTIYQNLTDNYLAVNNRALYREYLQRTNEIQKKISEKERQSINNSIEELIRESRRAQQKQMHRLQIVQWILIFLILLSLIIWTKLILHSRKKFKEEEKKLKTLKS